MSGGQDGVVELDGPRTAPASGGRARQLAVICHGYGADGDDLIPLAPLLGQYLPDAAFVAPNAPEACDEAPVGRQWFSRQDRAPAAQTAGVRRARRALDAFLDAELARLGLDDASLALIGFSQGTYAALFTGLRRAAAPAGIIGYSGALLAPETLEAELTHRPPVLLIHGDADDVVPVGRSVAAAEALRAAWVPVELMLVPGEGHMIGHAATMRGARFLADIFGLGPEVA